MDTNSKEMKIALIGYGKMGHAIERIARERGHEIVSIIDCDNTGDIDSDAFRSADVAIEFTMPGVAVDNYKAVFRQGVPLVSGTTGWGRPADLADEIARWDATFFWTSNFSVGVNIFFALNKYLSGMMNNFTQYTPSMLEVHHIHKLDHPSGTAVTLAEDIVSTTDRIAEWTEEPTDSYDRLQIDHRREGEVPGTHIVMWNSEVDEIKIEHRAKSRDGFALGAVMAAEWLKDKKGLRSMDEMMSELLKL